MNMGTVNDVSSSSSSSSIGLDVDDGAKNASVLVGGDKIKAKVKNGDVNSSPVIDEDKNKIKPQATPVSNEDKNNILPKATIAYAVSLTSCSANFITDGAAVLKHSIRLSSYPHSKKSSYGYKMVVFVHPDALSCIEPFKKLDYEIHIKETPIEVSKIRGQFLREHVYKTGCCGEKEFLKLYSWTLVDFPIVVHLDLDSLILQPFDDLYDSMLLDGDAKALSERKLPVMHDKPVPDKIEAFFTRDYNMANLGKEYVNVQGGFLVVRPNLQYFEEFKEAIYEGDFVPSAGWKGKYGGYFGGQQIQGLCAYFFDGLHPRTAVELNRCIYNQMNDKPKKGKGNKEFCLDNKETCEDCRETDISEVKSVHFTLCQKPWICPLYILGQTLCKEFHTKWFLIREDMENQLGNKRNKNLNTVDFHNDVFRGYCKGSGGRNYEAIDINSL